MIIKPNRYNHVVCTLGNLTDVVAPVRIDIQTHRGREVERRTPWLGPLVLARWATDDPHVWHDVNNLPDVSGILGGWPPAVVSERAVQVMLDRIQVIESGEEVIGPEPCQPGDLVRFTYLAFWRVMAWCVWVDPAGMVGLRIGILGYDHVIPVPWAALEIQQPVLAPQYGSKKRFTSAAS